MAQAVARQLQPIYGFVERNFRLLQRYWGWELMWIIYSLAITLSIGFLAVGMEMVSGVKVPQNKVLIFLLTGGHRISPKELMHEIEEAEHEMAEAGEP